MCCFLYSLPNELFLAQNVVRRIYEIMMRSSVCTAQQKRISNETTFTVELPIVRDWKKKPERKNIWDYKEISTRDLGDACAMLYQLRYKATYWEPGELWVLYFHPPLQVDSQNCFCGGSFSVKF